jgi:hypothetical protein
MKHLFTLIALFGLSLFAQTVPNYVPTNGLVGWWPFNGNTTDVVGGNNGSNNGATLTAGRFGSTNTAYGFNGNNNTIDFSNPFFGGGQKNSFTFHTVILFNSTNNAPNIWGKTLFWGEVNFGISSNNEIHFWWANSITGNKYSSIFSQPNAIQIGQWYSIDIVFQNSIGQIYLNGSPISTNLRWTAQGGSTISTTQIEASCNFDQIANSSKIGLRYSSGNPGNHLSGIMDEFGIWNRALTPAEIQNLYFSCSDTLAAQPVSNNASLGTNASFTASSSASGATYQWQGKSGNSFVNLSNAGQFSGVTTGTLTVSGITSANNGTQFRCIVDHGDCVDTSDVATLTACFDLTNQPSDRYVVAGTSTTFGLTTNDPSNCTYQWQTNSGFGYQNLSNAGQYSGTTSSTLAVANVSATNNNQLFRCIVTAGTCKDTTSEVRIILSGVGVSENSLQRVSVFPNPTRGLVDLGVALDGTYTLIGIDGRAVQTGVLRQILDFSNQPAGVYSLRLETPAGSRVVKVVKE